MFTSELRLHVGLQFVRLYFKMWSLSDYPLFAKNKCFNFINQLSTKAIMQLVRIIFSMLQTLYEWFKLQTVLLPWSAHGHVSISLEFKNYMLFHPFSLLTHHT